jgi:hypothetical protein
VKNSNLSITYQLLESIIIKFDYLFNLIFKIFIILFILKTKYSCIKYTQLVDSFNKSCHSVIMFSLFPLIIENDWNQ